MQNETQFILALIIFLALCFAGIGASVYSMEKQKISGCIAAGGNMVGEVCIIRNDCNNSIE